MSRLLATLVGASLLAMFGCSNPAPTPTPTSAGSVSPAPAFDSPAPIAEVVFTQTPTPGNWRLLNNSQGWLTFIDEARVEKVSPQVFHVWTKVQRPEGAEAVSQMEYDLAKKTTLYLQGSTFMDQTIMRPTGTLKPGLLRKEDRVGNYLQKLTDKAH